MKPASFLGLLVCASIAAASGQALAGGSGGSDDPSATPAPKKKKPKRAAPKPKKTDAATESATTSSDAATPAATPVPSAPVPSAPETRAADARPADAKPVPVADRPTESRHEDEDTGKAFSAAPLLGFGSNHFGFGTGVRAGYTLPQKVYLGATFMYHFGTSYGYGGLAGIGDYSTHVLYPAVEGGYDFHAGPVTIRPYLGLGVAFVSVSFDYPGGHSDDGSGSSLLIYPGATAHWNIPKSDFFVGGDVRMLVLTRGGDPSFNLFATAGIKF